MSNLLEIGDNVQRNLDDLSANFYNRIQDINPSIQDGYNLLCALTESREGYADVSFQSGLVYYDFSAYVPDYLRIFGMYNNNTERWMYPTTLIELYSLRDNWELANGDPYLFLPIDYKTVAIYPAMAVGTGTLTILYKQKADTLTANAVPELPQENHNVLEWYSTGDLLDQAQEFVKANDYSTMFDNGIDSIRKVLRNRGLPNHLYFKQDNMR